MPQCHNHIKGITAELAISLLFYTTKCQFPRHQKNKKKRPYETQTPSQHSFQLNKVNKILPSQLSAFNVEFNFITPCYSGSTGREGHTYGNQAGCVSHKATCAICSDPIPTETASHWWKFITKNTQKLIQMPIVQLFLYLHSISKLGAVFCTAETHTVTKPDVAWEITRFTSIKLLQQPSDHQGELLLMTKELIGGHGRTRWGLCQKYLQ